MAKCKKQSMRSLIFIATIILLFVGQTYGQTSNEIFKKIETGNWLDLSFRVVNEEGEELAFLCVEEMPEFPGGYDALAKFFNDTLKYPLTAIKDTIQGRVITKFSIDKDGKVCNIITIKGVRNDLDSACRKAISLMPNWTRPKFMNFDDNLLIQFILPIRFSLK
jgi:protein TonB